MNNWNELTIHPPDELLEVMDVNENIGKAYPTYYPFKVGESTRGKWSSPVIPCEPYWDGGWMIACEGLTLNINQIIAWRNVKKLEESHNQR